METYITLLKGINVGGHKIIKMAVLKSCFEANGFEDVTTYIQSGNIVFSYKKIAIEKLNEKIVSIISTNFGFQVDVISFLKTDYATIVNNNPFVKNNLDEYFLHISFLKNSILITESQIEKLNKNILNEEQWQLKGNAMYLYIPINYSKTKLNNELMIKTLNTITTTRNWKTALEILHLANKI